MPRTLRVYDNDGDFVIEIPDDAKVTFGYFNPGKPEGDDFSNRRRGQDERKTALRIYTNKDNQLAVFLGVKGFRDESLKLTRFKQKVTIEHQAMQDDEAGTFEFNGKRSRQLVAAVEDDSYQ